MKNKIIDNRYELVRCIGTGGFARVYKAWALNLEKYVALKKIHECYSKDSNLLELFRKEAVNTARLEHENIVRVIDFIKTNANEYYIVMEYISGRDLGYLTGMAAKKGTKLSAELAVHIAAEALKALNYAHGKKDELTGEPSGIIHRDVSPGNIMICFDGRVKLTDFGIAGILERKRDFSKAVLLQGKLSYMSPEQQCAGNDIDERSDIYSLGIILWELLTGSKLFNRISRIPPSSENAGISLAGIPEELKTIVSKALCWQRTGRYRNAAELIADLQKFLANRQFSDRQERLKAYAGELLKEEICREEKMADSQRKQAEIIGGSGKRGLFKGRRILIRVIRVLFISGMVFIVSDAFGHRKNMADKIRNLLVPRKVIIDTMPTGAEVMLSMGNTEVISSSGGMLTPLVIEKIIPGRYELILKKQGYEPVRRILISDRDKGISIDGGAVNGGTEKNKFIIPFRMKLVLNSAPVGATVRIDGELINGKTPLETTVTAGVHFVKMEYKGIGSIGAKSGDGRCVIDTSKNAGRQVGIDLRFWDFSCYESSHVISEVLSGKFLKMLNVESAPEEASLYIDGGKEPAGITPVHNFLIVTGYHRLRLEKYGYVAWEKDISLKDEPGISIRAVLKKKPNIKKTELQKETACVPADDATLIVDTRPDFVGSKIIIDGRPAGDTLRKLVKFPRGAHTVIVKHPDLQKPAIKTVFFNKDCQIILLKMNKAGDIFESTIE